MRTYGLARIRSFMLVDVNLRWGWIDRGSMKIAQDRDALVRMNISALMNCCSVDYVAPHGSLLVSCSLDDANTSLSLQRQKAMDLISSTRQVNLCEYGRVFQRVSLSSLVVSSIVGRLVAPTRKAAHQPQGVRFFALATAQGCEQTHPPHAGKKSHHPRRRSLDKARLGVADPLQNLRLMLQRCSCAGWGSGAGIPGGGRRVSRRARRLLDWRYLHHVRIVLPSRCTCVQIISSHTQVCLSGGNRKDIFVLRERKEKENKVDGNQYSFN
jgi:hypothetical protein